MRVKVTFTCSPPLTAPAQSDVILVLLVTASQVGLVVVVNVIISTSSSSAWWSHSGQVSLSHKVTEVTAGLNITVEQQPL